MSPGRSSERSSSRHAGLTRDEIVDTALALVEAGGGEALTMRKLAAELGVATTTIYWHVGNRDDLILAVIQRQAERQASTRIRGTTPAERIASAARNIWDNALAHRNVTVLASQVGATTLLALPLEAALVVELEAAGVTGVAARDGLRSLLACIAGFLVLAWRSDDRVPEHLRAGALWGAIADPHISTDTRTALTQPSDLDALFDATVAAVVAGILGKASR